MTWTAQQQKVGRPAAYYSAKFEPPGMKARWVTLGFLPASPPTSELNVRLRRLDPHGRWGDELVQRVCAAGDSEAAAKAVILAAMGIPLNTVRLDPLTDEFEMIRRSEGSSCSIFRAPDLPSLAEAMGADAPPVVAPTRPVDESALLASTPAAAPARRRPGRTVSERDPSGGMTLATFVAKHWTAVRSAGGSWKRERWWWETQILPALGDVRLVDLDEPKWTAFLAGRPATQHGRARALCQTAYRCALRHAVEELKWLPRVHPFRKIKGSTSRSLAAPEPLTTAEVIRLLDAAPTPMHRALFGLHFGEGTRPGEAMVSDWADIHWERRLINIRGTKNKRATATIGLTPEAYRELRPWWEALGRPVAGPMWISAETNASLKGFPVGVLRSSAERAGLNLERTRKVFPYLGRHTFATRAALSGIPSIATKRMMRHSSSSTVLETAYERASLDQVAREFAGFGEVDGRGEEGERPDRGGHR